MNWACALGTQVQRAILGHRCLLPQVPAAFSARAVALINDAAEALWEHAAFRGGDGLPDEVAVHKYRVGRPPFLGDLGEIDGEVPTHPKCVHFAPSQKHDLGKRSANRPSCTHFGTHHGQPPDGTRNIPAARALNER